MATFKMRLRTIMVLVAFVALLLGVLPCLVVRVGIGHTPLKITFVVADAMTSRPIDGATIELVEEDSPPATVVVRKTDLAGKWIREGLAKVISRRTCWESTYATRPPDITFRASAPAYEATAWMPLDSIEYRELLRSDNTLSTIDVKIRLSKSPSVPTQSVERILP